MKAQRTTPRRSTSPRHSVRRFESESVRELEVRSALAELPLRPSLMVRRLPRPPRYPGRVRAARRARGSPSAKRLTRYDVALEMLAHVETLDAEARFAVAWRAGEPPPHRRVTSCRPRSRGRHLPRAGDIRRLHEKDRSHGWLEHSLRNHGARAAYRPGARSRRLLRRDAPLRREIRRFAPLPAPSSSPARAARARSSSRGPSTPRATTARRPLRRGERGRDSALAHRERALRPRAWRVHRGDPRAPRLLPAGARRHALPRRGGRAAARPPGVASPRPRDRRGPRPRERAYATGRCAHRVRDACRARRGRRRPPVPRRPLLAAGGPSGPCSPLRSRKDDIIDLAAHLLASFELDEPRTLGSEAHQVLQLHHWPGNVRELRTVLLRAAATSARTRLDAEDVVRAIGRAFGQPRGPVGPDPLRAALVATHGNISAAARILGLPRGTFRSRLKASSRPPLN
jgi:hypothetical protein